MNHDLYQILVSAPPTPYMDWQVELLRYSLKRLGLDHLLIRLPEVYPRSQIYLGHNKPYSINRFVSRNLLKPYIVILDPDMIYKEPWFPVPQTGEYIGAEVRYEGPSSISPYVMHAEDIKRVAPLWEKYSLEIWHERKNTWIAEPIAFDKACDELGIKRVIDRYVSSLPPYDAHLSKIVHYAYKVGDWIKYDYVPWSPLPDNPDRNYQSLKALVDEYRVEVLGLRQDSEAQVLS